MSDIFTCFSDFLTMKGLIFLFISWAALSSATEMADAAEAEEEAESGWVPTPVLKLNESAFLRLDISAVQFASMLGAMNLDMHHNGIKINPALFKSARVSRTKAKLRTALQAFVIAIRPLIPDSVRSNISDSSSAGHHARTKRSVLGWLATTADLDNIDTVVNLMKSKTDRVIDFQAHLTQKLNSVTEQMSAFIKAGELDLESLSRSVIHLQSEVVMTAWTQACQDAILELNRLTATFLGGSAAEGLLHPLERGRLLSANLSNETFQLSFFVERFYSVMADCRQEENAPFVCRLPGPVYFSPGKFRGA